MRLKLMAFVPDPVSLFVTTPHGPYSKATSLAFVLPV